MDFHVYAHYRFPEYEFQEFRVMALVVDPMASPSVRKLDLGPLADIVTGIHRLNRAVVDQSPGHLIHTLGQKLYQTLWQELAPHLQGKDQLFLVPDGVLHLLPFALLRDEHGRFLDERHQLITIASPRELLEPDPAEAVGPPVLFFNPNYEAILSEQAPQTPRGQFSHFEALPFTQAEGEAISWSLRQKGFPVQAFYGSTASETTLRKVNQPWLLHLATHGVYQNRVLSEDDVELTTTAYLAHLNQTRRSLDRHEPFKTFARGAELIYYGPSQPIDREQNFDPFLETGIALAGVNTAGLSWEDPKKENDGFFTAKEVLALDLRGTRLVSLSACKTNVGDLRAGEGVYGLTRAFRLAGAQAVLATLWSVHDEGTAAFMTCFYDFFLTSRDPVDALHRTRAVMRSHPRWNHPYYWAPFVLIGR